MTTVAEIPLRARCIAEEDRSTVCESCARHRATAAVEMTAARSSLRTPYWIKLCDWCRAALVA